MRSVRGVHRFYRQKKLEGVLGNGQESVTLIKTFGGVILGIHKETDHSRLFGDEHCSVNRLGQQQFSVPLFLLLA